MKGFSAHGVMINKETDSQYIADCIFCLTKDKFYINKNKLLWDCKVCNRNGNFFKFLELVQKNNIKNFHKFSNVLYKDRKLPPEAFEDIPIGWNGKQFTLSIINNENVVDIKRYNLGGKLMPTPGCNAFLFNLQNLKNQKEIFLCEGEWDTIAMNYILKNNSMDAIAIGVPGANTFKNEWEMYFSNKVVYIMYDNDNAGRSGEQKVSNLLKYATKHIYTLSWPTDKKEGYDIRDFISENIEKSKPPKNILKEIMNLIKNYKLITNKNEYISLHKLVETYRKWLYMPNTNAIDVIFGTIIANRLKGDPIWLFLTAPSGSGKSELLSSVSECEEVFTVSSITSNTLISGSLPKSGQDPSLLPKLDGKVLVMKDFTSLLSQQVSELEEIIGILIDAYDGVTKKIYGNGAIRYYKSRFGIIAGVTNAIEKFSITHAALGARFLKYRITGNWDIASEEKRMDVALKNHGKEYEMREELQKIASMYMKSIEIPKKLPTISESYLQKLKFLSSGCVRWRVMVERNNYSREVQYKPVIEIGTRLVKQLKHLALGMCIHLKKSKMDWNIYKILRQIALNSVPDIREDMIHRMWLHKEPIKIKQLSQLINLPSDKETVRQALADMEILRIAKHVNNEYETWSLTETTKDIIEKGFFYDN